MYKKLSPLKSKDHQSLRLLPVTDYRFARGELVAPIVIDEIADVAREYPIVFPVGSALPVAMMGVEKDSNAYVALNGQWLASYIPAHIRHYPLALTRIPAPPVAAPQADTAEPKGRKSKDKAAPQAATQAVPEERFAVLVDVESHYVSAKEGDPMFNADGKLSGLAQQKMQILELMQNRAGVTQRLVKAIEDAGLLTERSIRIKREGEADRQVTGVRVIDEAALNKMSDAAFNQLRKAGALPLVYASLLSWANFRQGPIGKSHPLQQTGGLNVDDVIRFN